LHLLLIVSNPYNLLEFFTLYHPNTKLKNNKKNLNNKVSKIKNSMLRVKQLMLKVLKLLKVK